MGWGNAGAASQQTITAGDGYVEFSAGTAGDSFAGLTNGDPDQSYNIDFAMHVDGGNASIWEDGSWKANVGTYTNTDRFRVAVESGVVKYRKNGALLYTSTVYESDVHYDLTKALAYAADFSGRQAEIIASNNNRMDTVLDPIGPLGTKLFKPRMLPLHRC